MFPWFLIFPVNFKAESGQLPFLNRYFSFSIVDSQVIELFLEGVVFDEIVLEQTVEKQ
jgi:hypothetical protein